LREKKRASSCEKREKEKPFLFTNHRNRFTLTWHSFGPTDTTTTSSVAGLLQSDRLLDMIIRERERERGDVRKDECFFFRRRHRLFRRHRVRPPSTLTLFFSSLSSHLERDLAKRVHRHPRPAQVDPAPIGLDAHARGVVQGALDGHDDLHENVRLKREKEKRAIKRGLVVRQVEREVFTSSSSLPLPVLFCNFFACKT
jgi:hypothetical protein